MAKLKPNRKPASSPQNVIRMRMIIANDWGKTWKIVWDRAQATQEINRQNLVLLSRTYTNPKFLSFHHF